MKKNVAIITLGVIDISKSSDFYQNIFSLSSPLSDGDMLFFQHQNFLLALYHNHLISNHTGIKWNGDVFSGHALEFSVDSNKKVDDLLKIVEKHDGNIIKNSSSHMFDEYCGYFTDPDGHLWKIVNSEMSMTPQQIYVSA